MAETAAPPPGTTLDPDGSLLVEPVRFSMVPEWLLDADVSDCAIRLYAVLLRYGQSSGQRMPSRAVLAERLHKGSVDTVDRALRELTGIGAVTVERRRHGTQNLTNRYHLRTSDPRSPARAAPVVRAARGDKLDLPGAPMTARDGGGRENAATRTNDPSNGRTDEARVAAPVRPDPEVLTQRTTPPPDPRPSSTGGAGAIGPDDPLLAACGINDLDAYAEQVAVLRTPASRGSVRWTGPCLLAALQTAVRLRGRPAATAAAALLAVAADPLTRSPMRVAEAGPWWDHAAATTRSPARTTDEDRELQHLEALLADRDDRAALQARARVLLTAAGELVTRLSVARLAAQHLSGAS